MNIYINIKHFVLNGSIKRSSLNNNTYNKFVVHSLFYKSVLGTNIEVIITTLKWLYIDKRFLKWLYIDKRFTKTVHGVIGYFLILANQKRL